ncbi:MAG: hypothetical protein NWF08_08690 [Candidatus Bathyarchaeota archaeon]|nr:hypothetical protein [Candidatus Bathyarchaeota archaeon]
MSVQERNILYFDKPGFQNTNPVIEAVKKRLESGDLKQVIVPVTTGRTAEQFIRELGKEVRIVTISEVEVAHACKRMAETDEGMLGKLISKRLKKRSGKMDKSFRDVVDITFLPFCKEAWNVAKEILYAFSQGMKVAIEVSLAAVEIKKVEPYTRVIAVGGTGEGADTAIVVRLALQKDAFGKDPDKRLSVEEILAIPINKW